MKNKKWLLVLIIAFPSLFWLILETSTINSRRLPYYGPKSAEAGGDTTYHTVGFPLADRAGLKPLFKDTATLLYTVCFLAEEHRPEGYRLEGVWQYLNYKKDKIAPLPIILVAEESELRSLPAEDLERLDDFNNVMLVTRETSSFEALRNKHFFEKPYYIDKSFFLLVDANRHVRGYYDGRYASEIKRLLEEYQHLKLKEVKKEMIETNEIRTDS